MNIKLDENLPSRLTRILSNLGHNVDTVPQERLVGLDDQTVWHAAQQSERFFITQRRRKGVGSLSRFNISLRGEKI